MHCLCLSRPSLDSDGIFLVIQISESLHKPCSTLSLSLWEAAGLTFGESLKKARRDGKGALWVGSPAVRRQSTLPHPPAWHSSSLWVLCALCVLSPAVTAPCLWLWLPEPVIISDQGACPRCQRGWQQCAGAACALGSLGEILMAGPGLSYQHRMLLTSRPRKAGKCPQESWSATCAHQMDIKSTRASQGLF